MLADQSAELVVLRLLGAQRVGVGALPLEEKRPVGHLCSNLGDPRVGLLLLLPCIGLEALPLRVLLVLLVELIELGAAVAQRLGDLLAHRPEGGEPLGLSLLVPPRAQLFLECRLLDARPSKCISHSE
eukprot:scaffold27167_cov33-Phaeocystis_antarctica.AAC.1